MATPKGSLWFCLKSQFKTMILADSDTMVYASLT